MRVTIDISDDANELAQAHSERHAVSLGDALSELILQSPHLPTLQINAERFASYEGTRTLTPELAKQFDEDYE